MTKIVRVAPFLLLCVATVLVYLPGLDGPLLLDSSKIFGLEDVVDEHGRWAVFNAPAFGELGGRLLSIASLIANIQLAGELSPFAIKATNLLVHLLNGLLVLLIARRLVRLKQPDASWLLPVLVCGAWLLAPINVSTVLYGIQRMALLSALFCLLGMLVYLHARTLLVTAPAQARKAWLLLGSAFIVCLPLAVLSKPNGFLLPLYLLLIEYFYFNFKNLGLTPTQWKRIVANLLVFGLLAAIVAVSFSHWMDDYLQRDFTWQQRLLTQPRALFTYLAWILLPFGNDIGLFHDDFPLSVTLFYPLSTLFSLVALIGTVALCWWLRHRAAAAVFGVAFFFTAHLLESTVFPLELVFEHRNYLASFGVFFALFTLAARFVSDRGAAIAATVVAALYLVYGAVVANNRAYNWGNIQFAYTVSINNHPRSPRLLSIYADLFANAGRFEQSLAVLNGVVESRPSASARAGVQKLYVKCLGGLPVVDNDYRLITAGTATPIAIETSQALTNLLGLYRDTGCPELDVNALVNALGALAERYQNRGLERWSFDYYRAAFLNAAGEREPATRFLRQRLDAGELNAGFYLVDMLLAHGERGQAEAVYRQLEERVGADASARNRELLEDARANLERH